jgi:hypothetical protein
VTIIERPEWTQRAECRGLPLNMFFHSGSQRTALSICAECPVMEDCRAAVLDEERYDDVRYIQGVRGGLTGKERRKLRRGQPRPESVIVHGTMTGYKTECRRGLVPCAECRLASTIYSTERRRMLRLVQQEAS